MLWTRLGMLFVLGWGVVGFSGKAQAEWGFVGERDHRGRGADHISHDRRRYDAYGHGGYRSSDMRMAARHPYVPVAPREPDRYSMPVRPTLGGVPYHMTRAYGAGPVVPVAAYRPVVPPCAAGACPPAISPVNVNVQAPPSGLSLEAGYYVGRGIIGQPTVYAEGQPIRNFLRAFTP